MENVDRALQEAIESHLSHGRDPRDIKVEVLAAGYSETEWDAAYQAARLPSPIPAAPPISAVAPSAPSHEVVSDTYTTHASHSFALVIVGVLVAVIVGISTYLFLVPPAWLSSLRLGQTTGELPIPTSAEFVPQLVTSMTSFKTAKVSGQLQLELASREPGVRAFETSSALYDEADLALVKAFLPEAYTIDTRLSGYYDISDVWSPDTEGSLTLDAKVKLPEMEPQRFFLDVAGKVVTEAGVFVRVNQLELPQLLTMFIGETQFESLLQKWIQVTDAASLATAAEVPSFQRELITQITSRAGEIIFTEMANHEFVVVTKAEPITLDGRAGVNYTLQFQYVVLPALVRRINERFQAEFGPEFAVASNQLEQGLAELDMAMLAYAQDHMSYTVAIAHTGQLLQYEAMGRIAPDDTVFANQQLNVLLRITMSEHDQPIVVTAPLTFISRGEAEQLLGLTAASAAAEAAALRQTMQSVRSQAEISYVANNASYANVCTDTSLAALFTQLPNPVMCTARADAYRIYTEYASTTWWCVDSTGDSREVTEQPAVNAYSCAAPTSALFTPVRQLAALPIAAWRQLATLVVDIGQVAGISISVSSTTTN